MKILQNQDKSPKNIGNKCSNTPSTYTKSRLFTKEESKKSLKLLTCSIVCIGSFAFAFDYKDLNATIFSKNILQSDSNISIEEIVIVKDNIKQPLYLINDRYIATNIIDTKERVDFNANFEQKTLYQSFLPYLNAIPKDFIINLNPNGKSIQYLFLDPLCPYCQEWIKAFSVAQLKEINLNVVLTPLYSHGDLAMIKSALIVAENKSAKTDSEKIEILKKHFNSDSNNELIPNTEILDTINNYRNELFSNQIVTHTPSAIVKPKE